MDGLLEEIILQTRDRGAWRRLAGIVLTVLFVLFSILQRNRSATVTKEAKARAKELTAFGRRLKSQIAKSAAASA